MIGHQTPLDHHCPLVPSELPEDLPEVEPGLDIDHLPSMLQCEHNAVLAHQPRVRRAAGLLAHTSHHASILESLRSEQSQVSGARMVLYGDEARQTEPDRLGKSTHVAVAEVQASHSIEALGALRLLIGRDDVTVLVEPYDTKTLRVIDVVTEHGDAARGLELLHGAAQIVCQPDTE